MLVPRPPDERRRGLEGRTTEAVTPPALRTVRQEERGQPQVCRQPWKGPQEAVQKGQAARRMAPRWKSPCGQYQYVAISAVSGVPAGVRHGLHEDGMATRVAAPECS